MGLVCCASVSPPVFWAAVFRAVSCNYSCFNWHFSLWCESSYSRQTSIFECKKKRAPGATECKCIWTLYIWIHWYLLTKQPVLILNDIMFCLLPENDTANTANSLNVWASHEKGGISLEYVLVCFYFGQL